MIFIEAPAFERIRDRYLDDGQYRLLQAALMANPEAGDLIRGSGAGTLSKMSPPVLGKSSPPEGRSG